MGEGFALLTALLFGAGNNLVNKVEDIDKDISLMLTLMVNNAVSTILIVGMVIFGYWPAHINWNGLIFFALGGIFTSYLGRDLLFSSVRFIGPSRASSFKIAAPAFTVFIGTTFLGEKLSPLAFLSVSIIMLGLLFVVKSSNNNDLNNNKNIVDLNSRSGIILGLLCSFSFGFGNVLRKVGMMYLPSPIIGVAVGLLFSSLLLMLVILKKNKVHLFRDVKRKSSFINYLMYGVFASFALYSLFIAILLTDISRVHVLSSTEVLFTMAISYIFFKYKELFTVKLLIGSFVVSLGVALLLIS